MRPLLRRLAFGFLTLAGVAALLVIGVPAIVSRLDFFRIRMIEFRGSRYLDPDELVPKLGLPADAHILTDLAPVRTALESVPGIRWARLARRWPGTLVITLNESIPVAMVPVKGQLMVMDAAGALLPWQSVRIERALPVAPHDSTVATLLGRLRSADPEWYQGVDQVTRTGRDVVIQTGGRRVLLDVGADLTVIRNLQVVMSWLADSVSGWRRIDARVPSRFFVLKGTGST